MRMETPCTDSNNAVCVCDYGYYMSSVTGGCEPCTVCPRGHGVYMRCEPNHDTICEPCEDETYSDQESSLDPCMPCTICNDGSDELETQRECTPTADAVCFGETRILYFSDCKISDAVCSLYEFKPGVFTKFVWATAISFRVFPFWKCIQIFNLI